MGRGFSRIHTDVFIFFIREIRANPCPGRFVSQSDAVGQRSVLGKALLHFATGHFFHFYPILSF